jgi:hypothetical protein
MQKLALTQDTPDRTFTAAGEIAPTMVQALPFQDSASVSVGLETRPTAMHASVLTQDTLVRELAEKADVLALGTMLHTVPFHVSTSVWVTPPLPVLAEPTAAQKVALTHETPLRAGWDPGAGLGLGARLQVDPFHESINVAWLPAR